MPTCDGKASIFNFTANFCATNASVAGAVLHMLHLTDAQTVGKFLGGQNFTNCDAIPSSNATASTTSSPPVVTEMLHRVFWSRCLLFCSLLDFWRWLGCENGCRI